MASDGGTMPFSASLSIVSFCMRLLRILYQMISAMIRMGVRNTMNTMPRTMAASAGVAVEELVERVVLAVDVHALMVMPRLRGSRASSAASRAASAASRAASLAASAGFAGGVGGFARGVGRVLGKDDRAGAEAALDVGRFRQGATSVAAEGAREHQAADSGRSINES